MRIAAVVAPVAYVGTVALSNSTTTHLGLVPIGAGLLVTAGTFPAGGSLVVRDWTQDQHHARWIMPALIVTAALISTVLASPSLALASGLAFMVSEFTDWAVFSPLRSRSLPLAVMMSTLVAAPLDTIAFLHLAGFPVTPSAIAGQFLVKTALAAAIAALLWRHEAQR